MGKHAEGSNVPARARRATLRAFTPRIPRTIILTTVTVALAATSRAARPAALRSRVAHLTSSLSTRAKAAAAAVAVVAVAVAVAVGAVAAAAVGSPASPASAAPGPQLAQNPAAAGVAAGQHHATGRQHPALHRGAVAAPVVRHAAPAGRHRSAVVRHAAPAGRHRSAVVRHAAPAVRHAAPAVAARRQHHHGRPVPAMTNWHAITEAAAGHPGGGPLAPGQRLLPAPLAGGQAALPVTAARAANAQLITGQALRLHMGIRSAVIAVATAMQESTLENLNYGDRDSLGLFQQRPSAGWGTPAQITNPVYAADAFLHALAAYQAADPGWATQPLYEAAQGVQRSAFPYAYAQWESQAAHIVAQATRHLL
jgi:hypothetical protein